MGAAAVTDLLALGLACAAALVAAVIADRRRDAARMRAAATPHGTATGLRGRVVSGETASSPVGLPCVAFGLVLVRALDEDDGPVTAYRVQHRGGWTDGFVVGSQDGRTIVVERGAVRVLGPSHAIVRGDDPAEAHRLREYAERAGVAGGSLGVETRLAAGDEVSLFVERLVPCEASGAPFRAQSPRWKAAGAVRVVLAQPHALSFVDEVVELP